MEYRNICGAATTPPDAREPARVSSAQGAVDACVDSHVKCACVVSRVSGVLLAGAWTAGRRARSGARRKQLVLTRVHTCLHGEDQMIHELRHEKSGNYT